MGGESLSDQGPFVLRGGRTRYPFPTLSSGVTARASCRVLRPCRPWFGDGAKSIHLGEGHQASCGRSPGLWDVGWEH